MPRFLISLAATLCVALSTSAQTTRHVPTQFPTIQAAIDAATAGDTVVVQPGTYFERDISFRGKNITVRSATSAGTTIIDAQQISRHFVFNNGESASARLIGFALIGGRATTALTPAPATSTKDGGSILCHSASPTISSCVFFNSRTGTTTATLGGSGGAIASVGGGPRIENCTFVDCHAGGGTNGSPGPIPIPTPGGSGGSGGAILAVNGGLTVVGSFFSVCFAGKGGSADIAATGGGGGAIAVANLLATIEDCTFNDCLSGAGGDGISYGGNAGPGGAIVSFNATLSIKRSRFERCRGASGGFGDIRGAGGPAGAIFASSGFVTIMASSFLENTAGGGANGVGLGAFFSGVPGGAMYVRSANLTIRDSVFVGNRASNVAAGTASTLRGGAGGAIYLEGGSLNVDHSTFAANAAGMGPTAGEGGAIATGPVQGLWQAFTSPPSAIASTNITASIFWNDTPDEVAPQAVFNISDSNVQGGFIGNNLAIDPQFVDVASGNVHLLSGSPMIDAGGFVADAMRTDADGDPRQVFGASDIGADEFILGLCRFGTAGFTATDYTDVLRFDGRGGSFSGYLRQPLGTPGQLSLATPGADVSMPGGAIIWGRIGIPTPAEGLFAADTALCVFPGFLFNAPDHFLLTDTFSATSGAVLGPLFSPGSVFIPAIPVPLTITLQGLVLSPPTNAVGSTNALVIDFR